MPTIEPSNPLGMSFGDMLANAAVETGDAQYSHGKARLPDNDDEARHNATTVVMRAVRRVVRSYDWSWMDQEHAVTIDGEATPFTISGEFWRYQMPWSMAVGSAKNVGYRQQYDMIDLVTPDLLMRMRQADPNATGMPRFVSFRPAQRKSQASYGGCEMILYPTPTDEEVLEIQYRAYPEGMSNASDVFLAGPEYNSLLDAAIRYEAKFSIKDPDIAMYKAEFDEALAMAQTLDRRSRPAQAGTMAQTMPMPGDDAFDPMSFPPTITTVNGTVI